MHIPVTVAFDNECVVGALNTESMEVRFFDPNYSNLLFRDAHLALGYNIALDGTVSIRAISVVDNRNRLGEADEAEP